MKRLILIAVLLGSLPAAAQLQVQGPINGVGMPVPVTGTVAVVLPDSLSVSMTSTAISNFPAYPWQVSVTSTQVSNFPTMPWAVSMTSTTITGPVAVTISNPLPVSMTGTTVTNTVAVTGTVTVLPHAVTIPNPAPVSMTSTTVTGSVTVNGPLSVSMTSTTITGTSAVTGTVTLSPGTSVQVSNFPLYPWQVSMTSTTLTGTSVVTGTVFQGGAPWAVTIPNPAPVTMTSTTITGTVGVTQSTSPWVVSGTVTSSLAISNPLPVSMTSTTVTNTVTVGGSVSVSNFPATTGVTQSTSPWIVAGTVTSSLSLPAFPWAVSMTSTLVGFLPGASVTTTGVATVTLPNPLPVSMTSTTVTNAVTVTGTVATIGTTSVTFPSYPWQVSMTSTTITGFVTPLNGVNDPSNSTTTALGANGVFTGAAFDAFNYDSVLVSIFSDVSSSPTGVSFQFSSDGVNWDEVYTTGFIANIGFGALADSVSIRGRYFRIVYTNGAAAQATFRLATIYKQSAVAGDVVEVADPISLTSHAQLVRIASTSTVTGTVMILDPDGVATGTLSAVCTVATSPCPAGSTVAVSMAGFQGLAVTVTTSSAPNLTIVPECSSDGGTTWVWNYGTATTTLFFENQIGQFSPSIVNPQWSALAASSTYQFSGLESAPSNCRVRVHSYTSGSSTVQVRATFFPASPIFTAEPGVTSNVPPSVAYVGALSATSAPTQVGGVVNPLSLDLSGGLRVNTTAPTLFNSAGTCGGITTSTQCMAPSGAGLSYYLSGIFLNASTGTVMTVVSSTSTCAGAQSTTSTPLFGPVYIGGDGGPVSLADPIKVAPASALCCRTPLTASDLVTCVLTGRIAP